jgi:hemerythrin superfamily protein
MTFLDKIVSALTPPESDETRMAARSKARQTAEVGGWFALIIDQHETIEQAFAAARAAQTAEERLEATQSLSTLLTGHANAEETVLYPEMADTGHKAHASMAFEEQAMTKVQLALLGKLDPMSQDYLDKLEHIRGAVTHHMYQEESDWFPELQAQVPTSHQAALAKRFEEEVRRYVGTSAPSPTQLESERTVLSR